MDFFHTNFWAFREGRFDEWRSIYPMFVFVLGRLFTSQKCVDFALTAFDLRSCDVWTVASIFCAYFFGVVFSAIALARSSKGVYPFGLWLGIMLLSAPGFFALERGNYIMFAFLFVAGGALTKNIFLRLFLLALAINIKPYLIVLLGVYLFIGRVRDFYLGVMFCLLVNFFSALLIPESHYLLFFSNVLNFSGAAILSAFEKIWSPTSYTALYKGIERSLDVGLIPSTFVIELVEAALLAVIWCSRILILLFLYYLWRLREKVSIEYLSVCALVSFFVLFDSAGGYSLIFLFPFLSVFLGEGNRDRFWYVVFIFLLLFPLDVEFFPKYVTAASQAFLSEQTLPEIVRGVSVWSYFRPLILILFVVGTVMRLRQSLLDDSSERLAYE